MRPEEEIGGFDPERVRQLYEKPDQTDKRHQAEKREESVRLFRAKANFIQARRKAGFDPMMAQGLLDLILEFFGEDELLLRYAERKSVRKNIPSRVRGRSMRKKKNSRKK